MHWYLFTGTSGVSNTGMAHSNASFSLLLPGKVLHFNALNEKRRFRDRGNKPGAKLAWKELEEAGLGTFSEKPAARGTKEVSYKTIQVILSLFIYWLCSFTVSTKNLYLKRKKKRCHLQKLWLSMVSR